MSPSVHPDAYVAPTAVLSGQVSVGRGSCVLHGAVLTADGGPVVIGANCVIMEHAVLRGTPRHPVTLGDHVLAGPHSYLTGCRIDDEVFIATGAMVFNGAQMGRTGQRPRAATSAPCLVSAACPVSAPRSTSARNGRSRAMPATAMAAPESWTASMDGDAASRSWKMAAPSTTAEMGSRVSMIGRLAVSWPA